MHSNRIELNFIGPLQVIKYGKSFLFSHPIADLPGIYFSAVPINNKEWLVSYIGETKRSIGSRVKEHTIQLAGGNYRICDPNELKRGRSVILWNGLWRKGTRNKLPEFIDRIQFYAPVIKQVLETKRWFCAHTTCDKRMLRRIEGGLANSIKSAPPPGCSLLPTDVRYSGRFNSERPVEIRISLPVKVHGIPDKLIV